MGGAVHLRSGGGEKEPAPAPARATPGRPVPARGLLGMQQRIGNQAVQRALLSRDPVVQRVVRTLGGDWNAPTYAEYNSNNTRGVDIRLEFTPNASVDAGQVALTQTINHTEGGQSKTIGTEKQQVLQAHRTTPGGSHIDRLSDPNDFTLNQEQTNPIYGADQVPDTTGKTISDTTFNDQAPGYTQPYIKGQAGKEKAVLTDTPQVDLNIPPNSGQVFETTAVALSGTQKDQYYGSVSWGWQTSGTGAFSVLPFKRETFGTPSQEFTDAAQLWNASGSWAGKNGFTQQWSVHKGDKANIPLPIPNGQGLLSLPTRAQFEDMKSQATGMTPFSGQLKSSRYGQLVTSIGTAVNQQQWQNAKADMDTLVNALTTMNGKGAGKLSYWKSPAAKAEHFQPIYSSALAQQEYIDEQVNNGG